MVTSNRPLQAIAPVALSLEFKYCVIQPIYRALSRVFANRHFFDFCICAAHHSRNRTRIFDSVIDKWIVAVIEMILTTEVRTSKESHSVSAPPQKSKTENHHEQPKIATYI
jgi:hypothetical protein